MSNYTITLLYDLVLKKNYYIIDNSLIKIIIFNIPVIILLNSDYHVIIEESDINNHKTIPNTLPNYS